MKVTRTTVEAWIGVGRTGESCTTSWNVTVWVAGRVRAHAGVSGRLWGAGGRTRGRAGAAAAGSPDGKVLREVDPTCTDLNCGAQTEHTSRGSVRWSRARFSDDCFRARDACALPVHNGFRNTGCWGVRKSSLLVQRPVEEVTQPPQGSAVPMILYYTRHETPAPNVWTCPGRSFLAALQRGKGAGGLGFSRRCRRGSGVVRQVGCVAGVSQTRAEMRRMLPRPAYSR